MKTPDEIAQQVVDDWYPDPHQPQRSKALVNKIASAIQAHDEEREKEHQKALHDLKCTVKELRSINVEDGISLGKAYDWRAERDALRKECDKLNAIIERLRPHHGRITGTALDIEGSEVQLAGENQ